MSPLLLLALLVLTIAASGAVAWRFGIFASVPFWFLAFFLGSAAGQAMAL